MNSKVLRKENFGGLLFDQKTGKTIVLDKSSVCKFEDDNIIAEEKYKSLFHSTLSAPTRIFLAITKKCNLQCTHCSSDSGIKENQYLSFTTLKKLLIEFKEMGVFEISLNGGEPTMHPDFFRLCKFIKELNFPLFINSNGVYSKDQLHRLAKSNIDIIKISLAGLEKTNDSIRGNGTFKETIASIEYLKKTQNNVKINFTLTRTNLVDIFNMIDLANSLSCDIKIAPLVKVGRGKNLLEREISPLEGIKLKKEIYSYLTQSNIKIKVEIASGMVTNSCLGQDDFSNFKYSPCGMSRLHLSINSDGKAYCSGRQTDNINSVGNIYFHDFAEIWNQAQIYSKEISDSCGKCDDSQLTQKLIHSIENKKDIPKE